MSIATSFNLAIAILEERPADARSILRSLPLEESRAMPVLQERLSTSVDRLIRDRCSQTLQQILMDALRIELPQGSPDRVQAFMEGVRSVEELVETILDSLSIDKETT